MNKEELLQYFTDQLNKDQRISTIKLLEKVGEYNKTFKEENPKELDKVVSTACELFGACPILVMGESRKRELVFSRYLIYYQLRKQGLTYSRIGKIMNRGHSTILHGVAKLKNDLETKFEPVYSNFKQFEKAMKESSAA